MANAPALIGLGLYTPAEASRLVGISAQKLIRWLHGYCYRGQHYDPLWQPQIKLGDGHVYLGFRDLMEARVADTFIQAGVPALRIRKAILLGQAVIGAERPLSTNRFRTDGREIFLKVTEMDSDGQAREQLLNLFRRQYEFASIIDPILKNVVFDDAGAPMAWWPVGPAKKIIVDPRRSFGQPIDLESSVPVKILAKAGNFHGVEQAAKSYDVSKAAVRRAMEFVGVKELAQAA
jgi:hypothetical protein